VLAPLRRRASVSLAWLADRSWLRILSRMWSQQAVFRYALLLVVVFVAGCDTGGQRASSTDVPSAATVHRIKPSTLAEWPVLGRGAVSVVDGTLQLTESADSAGVVLLSPNAYPRDLRLSFEVQPLQFEGVCVVLLHASALDGGRVQAPEGYDGAWSFWTADEASVQSYAIAFHTDFHQPKAFLRKNPGFVELQARRDRAIGEQWHEIVIVRRGDRIRLEIDGETVLDAVDDVDDPLPGGQVGLRLRGPGDGSFSARYRKLRIEEL